MERKDCSTKKKYVHLKESERFQVEVLVAAGKKVKEIARLLRRHRSTIYRELDRGTIERTQYDLTEKAVYRADVGDREHKKRGKNKERALKIGKDRKLEEYIREKLMEGKFSPDAIIGQIKISGLQFEGMICTKTLYNYIDAGIFEGISNANLWEKRKKKKRGYRSVGRVSRTNRLCRSIEKRPKVAENREEYGHWEGDTIKGPQGSTASLLTLTERKSREEIIIWLASASQEAIKEALDGLEKKYGSTFKAKFKSITFDNGPEFLAWRLLEISVLDGKRRTITYFAHSYSSWERGSNEIHNRMIRRFIPKGAEIALFSQDEINKIQDWMNNYPRKILGYRTPRQVADENLESNQFCALNKFCRN
jgi:IS30 family transposase